MGLQVGVEIWLRRKQTLAAGKTRGNREKRHGDSSKILRSGRAGEGPRQGRGEVSETFRGQEDGAPRDAEHSSCDADEDYREHSSCLIDVPSADLMDSLIF